jgi:hypothetical protein
MGKAAGKVGKYNSGRVLGTAGNEEQQKIRYRYGTGR